MIDTILSVFNAQHVPQIIHFLQSFYKTIRNNESNPDYEGAYSTLLYLISPSPFTEKEAGRRVDHLLQKWKETMDKFASNEAIEAYLNGFLEARGLEKNEEKPEKKEVEEIELEGKQPVIKVDDSDPYHDGKKREAKNKRIAEVDADADADAVIPPPIKRRKMTSEFNTTTHKASSSLILPPLPDALPYPSFTMDFKLKQLTQENKRPEEQAREQKSAREKLAEERELLIAHMGYLKGENEKMLSKVAKRTQELSAQSESFAAVKRELERLQRRVEVLEGEKKQLEATLNLLRVNEQHHLMLQNTFETYKKNIDWLVETQKELNESIQRQHLQQTELSEARITLLTNYKTELERLLRDKIEELTGFKTCIDTRELNHDAAIDRLNTSHHAELLRRDEKINVLQEKLKKYKSRYEELKGKISEQEARADLSSDQNAAISTQVSQNPHALFANVMNMPTPVSLCAAPGADVDWSVDELNFMPSP